MITSTLDLADFEAALAARPGAPEIPQRLAANAGTDLARLAVLAHRAAIVDGTYPMTAHVRFEHPVDLAAVVALGLSMVRLDRDDDGDVTVLLTGVDVSVVVVLDQRSLSVELAARDVDTLDRWQRRFNEAFPPTHVPGAMRIRSWAMGPHGPTRRFVRHDFSLWEDAQDSYPTSTRSTLDHIVGLERPAGGSMMVWHGSPGTGKTTAIRALARSWASWCDVELVIDPEALFASASYLMTVLTAAAYGDAGDVDYFDDDSDEVSDRWKLVIIEDCDDLLRGTAASGSGGQLSRLLNVSDGLLGQELKVIVLFTTNAPLSAVHPALLRPGRCLATVEFEAFTAAEVAARASGLPARSMTLAEVMAAEGGVVDVIGAKADTSTLGYL